MTRCINCRTQISPRATICPHCGEPDPGRRNRPRSVFLWLTLLALVAFLYFVYFYNLKWLIISLVAVFAFNFLRRKV